MGVYLHYLGRFEESIERWTEAFGARPDYLESAQLMISTLPSSRHDDAIEVVNQLRAVLHIRPLPQMVSLSLLSGPRALCLGCGVD